MSNNKDLEKTYTNGQITVKWQPGKCIHSHKCFTDLPEVFDPQKRPWINMDGANSEGISAQVAKCPSGALSIVNKGSDNIIDSAAAEFEIEILPNGPLLVKGPISLKMRDGSRKKEGNSIALCRCGNSGNKPYCDGTHRKINFKDE